MLEDDKETLLTIIKRVRKNDNFKQIEDNIILEKLINNEINFSDLSEHYLPEPEEVQLAAVKQDGHNIKYINNPSEEVQLTAVKQDKFAIGHIKNPSEKVLQYLGIKDKEEMTSWVHDLLKT